VVLVTDLVYSLFTIVFQALQKECTIVQVSFVNVVKGHAIALDKAYTKKQMKDELLEWISCLREAIAEWGCDLMPEFVSLLFDEEGLFLGKLRFDNYFLKGERECCLKELFATTMSKQFKQSPPSFTASSMLHDTMELIERSITGGNGEILPQLAFILGLLKNPKSSFFMNVQPMQFAIMLLSKLKENSYMLENLPVRKQLILALISLSKRYYLLTSAIYFLLRKQTALGLILCQSQQTS
jgi:hypothetical protein